MSNINDLIKSRLQEINSNVPNTNSLPSKNGFAIPKLNFPPSGSITSPNTSSLDFLKKIRDAGGKGRTPEDIDTITHSQDVLATTKKLEDLSIKQIDLTQALNNIDAEKPAHRRPLKPKDDIVAVTSNDLSRAPLILEFCEINLANFRYSQFISEPSGFGMLTCKKFRKQRTKRITIDHRFYPKHTITRFTFNTKSPDDVVISKNSKFKI